MRCHALYQSGDLVWRLFYPHPDDADAGADAPGARANLLARTAGGETVLFDPGAARDFPAALTALTAEVALESVTAAVITRAGLETCSALPLWRRVCPAPLRVFAPAEALDAVSAHDPDAAAGALPGEGAFAPAPGPELTVIPAPQLPSADAVSLYDGAAGVLYAAAAGAGGWDEDARSTAPFAENFTRRAEAMAAHHARVMPSAAARRAWTARVRGLDVRFMAPERGPVLRAAGAARFFEWFENTAPEAAAPAPAPQGDPGWSAAEAAAHEDPHAGLHADRRGAALAAPAHNPDAGAGREAQLDAALHAALNGPGAGELDGAVGKVIEDAAVLDAALGGRSGEDEKLDKAVGRAIQDAAVLEASDAGGGGPDRALSAEDLDEALDDLIDEAIYIPAPDPGGAQTDAAAEPAPAPEETADADPEPEGPGPGAQFRLITRGDFDGVASAVLLEEIGLVREITFVHPKDMQDGLVPVTAADITANMPYAPGVHLAFDHHISETGRAGADADNYINDPDAPSAARVIYEYFGGRRVFENVSAKMLEAADKADTGRFTIDEVLDPKDWDLLHFLIDPRTGLGRFREFQVPYYEMMMELIDACRDGGIADILASPDIRERADLYMRHRGPFEEQIKRCARVQDRLVILDLRGEDVIYAGSRFLIYALFPQCRVSMHVMWGPGRRNVVFACGKSIFDRSAKVNIGGLMLEYGGGGGHAAAGTCQISVASAERALSELAARIIREG